MTNTTKQLILKNDLRFYDAIGQRLNELLDKDICQLIPLLSNRSKIYQANNYEISYGFGIKCYESMTIYLKENAFEGVFVELVKWGPGKVKEKVEKKKLQGFKNVPETIVELLEKITTEVNYSAVINSLFDNDSMNTNTLAMGTAPF